MTLLGKIGDVVSVDGVRGCITHVERGSGEWIYTVRLWNGQDFWCHTCELQGL